MKEGFAHLQLTIEKSGQSARGRLINLIDYACQSAMHLPILFFFLPMIGLLRDFCFFRGSTIPKRMHIFNGRSIINSRTIGITFSLISSLHEASLALIFCFNCLYVWIPSYQACGFISNSYWLSAFLLTQRADRFITQIISDLPKSGVNTRAIGCSKLIMSFSATAEPADVLVYSTPAFNILLPILYRQSLPICRCERYSESQPIRSRI